MDEILKNIEINKVSKIKHLQEVYGYIDELDEKIPGNLFVYKLKLGDKEMTYSDSFVENILKKEFIKYLNKELEKA